MITDRALANRATDVAAETYNDAYTAARFGRAEWERCANLLLQRRRSDNLREQKAALVLRSKAMRWAADGAQDPDRASAEDLARLLDDPKNVLVRKTHIGDGNVSFYLCDFAVESTPEKSSLDSMEARLRGLAINGESGQTALAQAAWHAVQAAREHGADDTPLANRVYCAAHDLYCAALDENEVLNG